MNLCINHDVMLLDEIDNLGMLPLVSTTMEEAQTKAQRLVQGEPESAETYDPKTAVEARLLGLYSDINGVFSLFKEGCVVCELDKEAEGSDHENLLVGPDSITSKILEYVNEKGYLNATDG